MSPFQACMSSKESSIWFQACVRECNQHQLDNYLINLEEHLTVIINDKRASYVIQVMIEVHESTKVAVTNLCRKDFESFSQNEYASRVIQKLIQIDQNFKKFVALYFMKSIELAISNLSTALLLIACIQGYEDVKVVESFFESLLNTRQDLMTNKLFRRIMVSFARFCDEQHLSKVSDAMNYQNMLIYHLRDKYSTYLLVILIDRNHPASRDLFRKSFKAQPLEHFRSSCFKILVSQLLSSESAGTISFTGSCLQQLDQLEISQLKSKKTYYLFFVLLSITPRTDPTSKLVLDFLQKTDWRLPAIDPEWLEAEICKVNPVVVGQL